MIVNIIGYFCIFTFIIQCLTAWYKNVKYVARHETDIIEMMLSLIAAAICFK